jgi:hypothetical protein
MEEGGMHRFVDLLCRIRTWVSTPRTPEPKSSDGPIVTSVVWLVAIPYFFGSAIYCGISLTKWAFDQPFRPDAMFAVMCAMMGAMVSVMLALTFRSRRTLQRSSADQTG